MSDEDKPSPAHLARAKVIALAFARTSEYHRKTALLAGVIALAFCGLALFVEFVPAKGVALLLSIVFAVFAYRAMKISAHYLDPGSSPVLYAIAKKPTAIASVTLNAARTVLTVADDEGSELHIRIDDKTPHEPLIKALKEHAPHAEVAGD